MTTESRDIVERLEARFDRCTDDKTEAADVLFGLADDLRDAITTIKFLRKAAGAVTQGPSFAEIAKDLPRKEPTSLKDRVPGGAYIMEDGSYMPPSGSVLYGKNDT